MPRTSHRQEKADRTSRPIFFAADVAVPDVVVVEDSYSAEAFESEPEAAAIAVVATEEVEPASVVGQPASEEPVPSSEVGQPVPEASVLVNLTQLSVEWECQLLERPCGRVWLSLRPLSLASEPC